MTPKEFYEKYNGKVIDDDGAYGAQCVDGFRIGCKALGITAYPTVNGWADGYWYSRASHANNFDFITNSNDFKDGDWVIWARGSVSHPSSHIAMYFQGKEFGENQGGNRGFCLKSTNFSDALGALRPKAWTKSESETPVEPVENAVYRLYNANTGEHFFTADIKEANNIKKLGWKYEGVAFKQTPNGVPVYRLYNPNNGDHMYTVSKPEADGLVALGWKNEGIGFYVSQQGNPIYRAYNEANGQHIFTDCEKEVEDITRVGWHFEGVAFYD